MAPTASFLGIETGSTSGAPVVALTMASSPIVTFIACSSVAVFLVLTSSFSISTTSLATPPIFFLFLKLKVDYVAQIQLREGMDDLVLALGESESVSVGGASAISSKKASNLLYSLTAWVLVEFTLSSAS